MLGTKKKDLLITATRYLIASYFIFQVVFQCCCNPSLWWNFCHNTWSRIYSKVGKSSNHRFGRKIGRSRWFYWWRNGNSLLCYYEKWIRSVSLNYHVTVDVLWGQPIKLVQVASTLELRINQWNDLLFFDIVPCHFCGASELQTLIGHNYFTF